MLTYQHFVENVDERAQLGGTEHARAAVDAVLASVAASVGPEPREALADVLPGDLRPSVERATRAPANDLAGLLRLVAAQGGVRPERARYAAHAVLSYVAEAEPDVAEQLRRDLPTGAEELFSPTLPEQGASAAAAQPKRLTPGEVDAATQRLRGWSGDTSRLERTVALPPGQGQAQLDRVRQAEQELNHHARIEQRPGGIVFQVWTHTCDCVTELDVELARRIDEAVEGL